MRNYNIPTNQAYLAFGCSLCYNEITRKGIAEKEGECYV